MKYLVDENELIEIADTIREKTRKNDSLEFPNDFINEINNYESSLVPKRTEDWVRPQGCADLDAFLQNDEHNNVMYFTVDNVHFYNSYITINISSGSQKNKFLDRGHIENGIFIIDETIEILNNQNNNCFFQTSTNIWPNYPVFRAYCEDSSNPLAITIPAADQPIIEVVLKTLISFNCSNCITHHTKRIYIDGSPSAFSGKTFLQKVYIKDTSKITSFASMFLDCRFLTQVNFKDWDVSNGTRFDHMFRQCIRLKQVDFSNWENNKATTLERMFDNCMSIEKIIFGKNFKPKPTTLFRMFNQCYSLKEIIFSQFDLTTTTNMDGMFFGCISLKKIENAEYLDTSAVTRNNYPSFADCYSLQKIPNGFVWNLLSSSGSSGFNGFNAKSFIQLDLSNTEHTEKITFPPAISNLFWLEKIDYHGWDTSGITGFPNGNWKSPYPYYVNLDGWDLTHLSSISNFWNQKTIKEYYPPKIAISHSYNDMSGLDHNSRLRIINILPTTTDTVTLTLGNVKNGLTDAEIAIATQKGWTVA